MQDSRSQLPAYTTTGTSVGGYGDTYTEEVYTEGVYTEPGYTDPGYGRSFDDPTGAPSTGGI
jgi:hypothetical protein